MSLKCRSSTNRCETEVITEPIECVSEIEASQQETDASICPDTLGQGTHMPELHVVESSPVIDEEASHLTVDVEAEVIHEEHQCISETEVSEEKAGASISPDILGQGTHMPELHVVESSPVIDEEVSHLTVDVEAEGIPEENQCISETEVSEEEKGASMSTDTLEQGAHMPELDVVESSPVIDEEASHLNVDVEADVIAEPIECISEIKVSQEETEENTILDVIEQDTHLAESDIVESIPVVDEEICHLSAEVQPTDVETEVITEPIECVSEIEVSQQETDASISPDTLGQGTHMPELHVVESSPVIDEEVSHLTVDIEAEGIPEENQCISETEVLEEEKGASMSTDTLEQGAHMPELDVVESSPVIDEEASHLNVDVEADVIAEPIECISEIKVSQEETEENTILDVIEQDTHLAESDIVESIPVVDEEICHLSAEVQPTDVETEVITEPIECVSEIEVSQQESDASISPDTLGQGTHMPELHVVESSPVIDEEASHLTVDVEAEVIHEEHQCISETEVSEEETGASISPDILGQGTHMPELHVVESSPVIDEEVSHLTVDVEAEGIPEENQCISETEVSEEEKGASMSTDKLEQGAHMPELDVVESSPVIDEEASHLNVDVEADVIAEPIECISEIKASQEETEENTILDVIEQDTHLAESDIVESIPVVDEEICHLSAEVQPTDVETEVITEPIECVSEIEVSQQETDASISPDTLGQGTHMPELHVVESSPVIDEEASHLNVDVEADVIAEPIECISEIKVSQEETEENTILDVIEQDTHLAESDIVESIPVVDEEICHLSAEVQPTDVETEVITEPIECVSEISTGN